MGRRCCVAKCPSTSRLLEHHGVTYHSFPLDPIIRTIWIKNSRISLDRQITKSVLVCSRHFRRVDFNTIRNGKYLLKPRVFPTVFPWGKMDAAEIEADHRALQQVNVDGTAAPGTVSSSGNEDVIKATVDQIVSQIMAESAERNATAAVEADVSADKEMEVAKVAKVAQGGAGEAKIAVKESKSTAEDSAKTPPNEGEPAAAAEPSTDSTQSSTSNQPKYSMPHNLIIGARVEAKSVDGSWLNARIVEVNEAEQTLLIRFERNHKIKVMPSTSGSYQEWMAITSERVRQRVRNPVLPVFELEEKCMARWSGPRKFPGTIKKLLGHDTYEVLFDDGYSKNVRAVHMNKLPKPADTEEGQENDAAKATAVKRSSTGSANGSGSSSSKKSKTSQRKDWPLLDMSSLDLDALGLPEIPHDGEWTCHWVNDQPIGTEGFLIVGEHQKPTVIVEDWRLPPGWIKHMYQRSNVLGKWDVILVSPSGKRFRSKSDLKVFLESQDCVYNPDVYDFSIHRRRAKDINAYVYTGDYSPQPPHKPKTLNVSALDTSMDQSNTSLPDVPSTPAAGSAAAGTGRTEDGQFRATPVCTLMPPADLMSPETQHADDGHPTADMPEATVDDQGTVLVENGYAFIGGLKVFIVDNLFVCPGEGCGKTYRKEDVLLIHIRHYHKEFAEYVSHCPKMQELAVKRTHASSIEQGEAVPKNQIPNQQFFAKMHQQDMQQKRAFKPQGTTPGSTPVATPSPKTPGTPTGVSPTKSQASPVVDKPTTPLPATENAATPETLATADGAATVTSPVGPPDSPLGRLSKRPRFSSLRRSSGSRKSNRQRSRRRPAHPSTADPDSEETHQSLNTPTLEGRPDPKKRRLLAGTTPSSSSAAADTAVSTPSSNDQADINAAVAPPLSETLGKAPQYINENGQLIRIVRMRQEEIINCICEYGEEDGLMIQCELCLSWQHGGCNGIVNESQVPDKYVCYICRNPPRVRKSMRYKHDQEWLFDGKLPVAGYHTTNPMTGKQSELLKRSHTLTGNLLDAKRAMHSLRVKMNISRNRCHPKLYLWAKRWDEDQGDALATPSKRPKPEQPGFPHVPQPEAAIDPEECQFRLMEHVKVQQSLVLKRLNEIEAEVDELENEDFLNDLKNADISVTKEAVATFVKELETLKRLARLNYVANEKEKEAANSTA
ncbi:uncharacterized protein LOC117586643 [Drosophila guanche]|uniref:Blast:PHD finger protein 20-like protein 1 n=1 Tax=Drosophila guanche TaxID=7266 RepID=A0A3B0JQI6_DROGU|nr:uncharacterized protein LOC117586643 [Drosophila guanche]SPP84434.1 blast:PHD finger protein 20-like protein 1 [Drosophila guanche]